MQHHFAGHGPRGYVRSDQRILEDVCEALAEAPELDASSLHVTVRDGVVVLDGRVAERVETDLAEALAERVRGVKQVEVLLRAGLDRRGERLAHTLGVGVLGQLAEDHRVIRAMFDIVTATPIEDPQDRRVAFAELRRELIAHARAEDEVVYPALAQVGERAAALRKARQEHALVERLIEEVTAMTEPDDDWMAKIEVLRDLTERHVRQEEREVLPRALARLEPGREAELVAAFGRSKQQHLRRDEAPATAGRDRGQAKRSSSPPSKGAPGRPESGKGARK